MKISVVISTMNKPKMLKDTIASLKKSNHKDYEIIVIDAGKKQKIAGVRYIHAPGTNLSQSRNIGINASKGDIIAFTDDDCEVDKNWLAEINKTISEGAICCTGRTLTHKEYTNPEFEKNFSFDRGPEPKVFKMQPLLNPFSVGSGNNMAFKRRIFEEVGSFDKKFGMGTKYPTEDIDMFYRILKSGNKISYNPKAIVLHKDLIKDVYKTAYVWGIAAKEFLKKDRDLTKTIFSFALLAKLTLNSISNPVKREYLKGYLK